MNVTWYGDAPPPMPPPLGLADRLRVAGRGSAILLLLVLGLAGLLVARLVERPLCGARRPVSARLVVLVCRGSLRVLGLRVVREGGIDRGAGAVVANHCSWLDILVLNALAPVVFVSKADVARWPGIGWLARATGTLFIDRARTQAAAQAARVQARLAARQLLLFFPEGTSSDGLRVLPFRTPLFAAFSAEGLPRALRVQPVALRYAAPPGRDARFYGWWGDMDLAPHLLAILAAPRQGRVEVLCPAALSVPDFADRKALAAAAEAAVRDAHASR